MSNRRFFGLIVICLWIRQYNTTVLFQLNPGCDLSACQTSGYPALFYGNQPLKNSSMHVLYSSFDLLTISIIETRRNVYPHVNYSLLFDKSYSRAINFGSSGPLNMFSFVFRRLMLFNDTNDTAKINDIKQIYWFNRCQTNLTIDQANITQPRFSLPLDDVRYVHLEIVLDLFFLTLVFI